MSHEAYSSFSQVSILRHEKQDSYFHILLLDEYQEDKSRILIDFQTCIIRQNKYFYSLCLGNSHNKLRILRQARNVLLLFNRAR